jgi:hypothetical protein
MLVKSIVFDGTTSSACSAHTPSLTHGICMMQYVTHCYFGHAQVAPSKVRDIQWDTQSCCAGWCVQGATASVTSGSAGTVSASPVQTAAALTASGRSCSGECLAVGDSYGAVKLLRYPAAQAQQVRLESVSVMSVSLMSILSVTVERCSGCCASYSFVSASLTLVHRAAA